MEAMESSASSKVTVEYHDPSGVFSLIQDSLISRLPLRNLNWKSPSRPLRRIDALHVDFVATHASAEAPVQPVERPKSLWVAKSASNAASSDAVSRERRHQIPGLRQTPYLKLFLLRCDDKDTYKAETRRQVREWLRQVDPTTQSTPAANKQGYHDASEWMIIHIVIPDTVAASEPRWRPDKKDPDELLERSQSKTKWPTKSPSTVFDKLRADFNPSGKNALERVAQIRLQKRDLAPELLPKTPVSSIYTETPQEQENAWQDLIAKFKILILQSFDLRVSQYEEDIREKESQRSLPGWNFCTFFTLKEGLARGFEAVGLVEDALAIYEELSAGLDASLRLHDGPATFLGDLAPLKRELEHFVESSESQAAQDATARVSSLLETPLDLSKKDYRGQIVSSTIALFDFQTYIFARQRELLYRLGNFQPQAMGESKPGNANKGQLDDELAQVAEVCRRTTAFVTSNARVLRNELSGSSNIVSFNSDLLIDQAACSWTYSVIEQVLLETASPALAAPAISTGSQSIKEGSSFNFPQGANSYPVRRSSLHNKPAIKEPKSKVIYENEKYALSGGASETIPAAPGTGLAELAAGRGELFLMQRRMLESLAKKRHWLAGWAAIEADKPIALVSLDDDEDHGDSVSTSNETEEQFHQHLLCDALGASLVSAETFRQSFEALNDLAVRHFILGNRTKSAESLLGDHALLKFQTGDYANAAQYFSRVVPKYLTNRWSYVQAEMLRVYARCLKELHRRDEFVRITLTLLTKVIARRRAKDLPSFGIVRSDSWVDEDSVEIQGSLAEIIELSAELPYNFSATLQDFFGDVQIGTEVNHYGDKDGFWLALRFRHLLEENAPLDRIRLKLVSVDDNRQEIWLESEGPIQARQGAIELKLHSAVSSRGLYSVDRLIFEAKKLHFVQHLQTQAAQPSLALVGGGADPRHPSDTGPCVMLYPRHGALDARAWLCPDIHIDKQRSLHIAMEVGSNDLTSIELRLRPASAGLRLHVADITMVEDDVTTPDLETAGMVKLGQCSAEQVLTFQLPYKLDTDLAEISVHLEASYVNNGTQCIFRHTAIVSTRLPIDVDVNDIFSEKTLFSRFGVRTTTEQPLIMEKADLTSSSVYDVKAMACPPNLTVFENQPVCLTYKILKTGSVGHKAVSKVDSALTLTIKYSCLTDLFLHCLTSTFEIALLGSVYKSLSRLLIPAFQAVVKQQISTQTLEDAALLARATVYSYESMDWEAVVHGLAPQLRREVLSWLGDWHNSARPMSLSLDSPPNMCRRVITISVDVPTVDIVHTASLQLTNIKRASPHLPPLVLAGQPIFAKLRLRYTTAWAASSATNKTTKRDFVCMIHEAPETWLIGGPKRITFSSSADEETVFDVLLIPTVSGTHLLPSIEIQPVANEQEDGQQAALTCQTDYKSAAQTVMVVQDTRVRDVTIMEGAIERAELVRASTDTRASKIIA